MNAILKEKILKFTGAQSISKVENVQALWSDFGAIERVYFSSGKYSSVIVKRIQPPTKMEHPRGWNSSVSQERKIKSYEIELHWYEFFTPKLPSSVRVPNYLFQLKIDSVNFLVLEDLNASGFDKTFDGSEKQFIACIDWLAQFHAANLNAKADGLWNVGTYWHLATRQEELHEMSISELKHNASIIDVKLSESKYQTIVHGDAKPANFCFNGDTGVAAVDFQYVGGGCGMKDLIYLMSSSLDENTLIARDEEILDRYFEKLETALIDFGIKGGSFQELEEEWRMLYAFAWADFVRFLKGWSPDHSRMNRYAEKQTDLCLNNLQIQS